MFLALVFVAGFFASTVLLVTDKLPSAPLFEDTAYYFFGANPFSLGPWEYGDVLVGSIERSLEVFSGTPAAALKHNYEPSAIDRLYATFTKARSANPTSYAWAAAVASRFLIGFSTIGILSALQFLVVNSFLAPLHYFRVFRRNNNREARAGERRGGTDLGAILVVVLVLIGVARTIRSLWRLVQRLTQYALSKIELGVLEVNG